MSNIPNFILALDVSTSVVGGALINRDTKELGGLFYVNLSKEKGLLNKIKALKVELQKYDGMVCGVAIEEPLVMFKKGFSRAQVLSLLSQFNGMCQLLTFLLYNCEPMMYNVNHVRKMAFPSLSFPAGCKRKELVQEACAKLYPDVDWPLKKNGQLKDECYDIADAMAVALCHIAEMNKINQ